MNNSLKNILLSEDTGEELKKRATSKLLMQKKTNNEKKGCKVVQSDSGTFYAKCAGTPKKDEPKKDEPKKDEPKKELVTPVDSKSIFDIYSKKNILLFKK